MRKQVDFDFRVFDVAAGGATDGGMSHEQVSEFVRANYLSSGWEVINSEVAQVSANHIFVAISLARYEEVGSAVTPPAVGVAQGQSDDAPARRGPGRPRQTENVS